MMSPEVLFYIIKLCMTGLVSFFAILLLSKKRDAAWFSLVCGFLLSYAGTVYEILEELGILSLKGIEIFGCPVLLLASVILPSLFFIIGFIMMLAKKM